MFRYLLSPPSFVQGNKGQSAKPKASRPTSQKLKGKRDDQTQPAKHSIAPSSKELKENSIPEPIPLKTRTEIQQDKAATIKPFQLGAATYSQVSENEN